MYRFALPADDLDLRRCVTSGQVFRWTQNEQGIWTGFDGDAWFRIDGDAVESNHPQGAFQRLFRLDVHAGDVARKLIELGPELEPYVQSLSGLRLMRPSDPVETFFSFLCTPNNHIKRITGMINHLASFGPDLGFRRFPDVEVIAGLHESHLRALGFGYRAATIPHIARELQSRGGRAYLTSLAESPYEEAHRELCEFKGIGPKLADCIALFALDHTEAAPIDTHVWQAVTRLYFPDWAGSALTDVRYRTAGDHLRSRFGPLAAWAQQFLFFDNHLNWRARSKQP